jgi:hypothetical protein
MESISTIVGGVHTLLEEEKIWWECNDSCNQFENKLYSLGSLVNAVINSKHIYDKTQNHASGCVCEFL